MPRPPSRRRLLSAALAVAVLGAAAPFAAAQTAPPPRTETVATADGWALPVSYYEAPGADENTPVVILLHGAQESRKNWESLASYLQKTGRYAVLAPDFRKHGEAMLNGQTVSAERLSPQDYKAMTAFDFEAVKALAVALHQQKKLNVRKLGVVAADEAGPIALLATYADWRKMPLRDAPDPMFRTPTGQDVRAVVLLSPAGRVSGLNPMRVVRDLQADAADIAFLIVVGERDRRGRRRRRGLRRPPRRPPGPPHRQAADRARQPGHRARRAAAGHHAAAPAGRRRRRQGRHRLPRSVRQKPLQPLRRVAHPRERAEQLRFREPSGVSGKASGERRGVSPPCPRRTA